MLERTIATLEIASLAVGTYPRSILESSTGLCDAELKLDATAMGLLGLPTNPQGLLCPVIVGRGYVVEQVTAVVNMSNLIG